MAESINKEYKIIKTYDCYLVYSRKSKLKGWQLELVADINGVKSFLEEA